MGVLSDLLDDRRARWSAGLGGLTLAVGFGGLALGRSLVAQIAFGLLAAALAAALVLFFGTRLVRALRARRQSRFEAELVAREGVAERRAEWKNWSQELDREGIDRYSLPFFLLVGEPQSGKSVLLQNSGLSFPFGQAKLSGVAGTRGCDWWFTQEAVVLDIAGRLFTHESSPSDAAEWQAFLAMLGAYRPLTPADGVLLVLPCDGLLTDGSDAIAAKADRIRASLLTLVEALDVSLPIYVVLTKGDRIFGFAETVHRLELRQREQMFGWSRGATAYARPYAEDELRSGFRELVRRSRSLRAHALATATLPEAIGEVDRLYAFPDEFAGLEDALMAYLNGVFGAPPLDRRLFLRGLYLTSGLQVGVPIARLCHDAFRDAGQADFRKLEAIFEKQRAYFIKDLIRKRVFSERGLVEPSKARVARAKRARLGGYAASAAALALSLWLAGSYFLQDRDERGDAARIAAIGDRIAGADHLELLAQSRELRDLAATYAPDTAADRTLGAAADDVSAAAFDEHFDRLLVPAVAEAVRARVVESIGTLRIAGQFSFERLRQVTLAALALEAGLRLAGDATDRGAAARRALPPREDLLAAALAVGLERDVARDFEGLLAFRRERGGASEPLLAADLGTDAAAALAERWREFHGDPARRASAAGHWAVFADVLGLAARAQTLEELAAAANGATLDEVDRYVEAARAADGVPTEQARDDAALREAFDRVVADADPLRAFCDLRTARGASARVVDPFDALVGERVFAPAGEDGGVALAPRLPASNDALLRELCHGLLVDLPSDEAAIDAALATAGETIAALDVTRAGGLAPRAAGRAALGAGVAAWFDEWRGDRPGPRARLAERVDAMRRGEIAVDVRAALGLRSTLQQLQGLPCHLGRPELGEWIDDLDDLTAPARKALEDDLRARIEDHGLAAIDGGADLELLAAASVRGDSDTLAFVRERIETESALLDDRLTPTLSRQASLALALRSISSACALEALEGTLVATNHGIAARVDLFATETHARVEQIVHGLGARDLDWEADFLADDDVFYLEKLAGLDGVPHRDDVRRAAKSLRAAWIEEATSLWSGRATWTPAALVEAVHELDQFEGALGRIAGELPDRQAELERFRDWYRDARDRVVAAPTGVSALLDAVGRPPDAAVVEASADRRAGDEVRAELASLEQLAGAPFDEYASALCDRHARLALAAVPDDDAGFAPADRLAADLPLLAAASVRREIADLALARWRAIARSDEGRRVLRYLVERDPTEIPTPALLRRFLDPTLTDGATGSDGVRLGALLAQLGLRVDAAGQLAVAAAPSDGDPVTHALPPPAAADDLGDWRALVDLAHLVDCLTGDPTALIATLGLPRGADGTSPGWQRNYFRIENGTSVNDATIQRGALHWGKQNHAWQLKLDPTGRLDGLGSVAVTGRLRVGWQNVAQPFDAAKGDVFFEASGALAPLLLCWRHSGVESGTPPRSSWTLRAPLPSGQAAELNVEFNRKVPPRPRIPAALLER